MSSTNSKMNQFFRIAIICGGLSSLFFVPWILVKAWVLPLPSTVQSQLDEAVEHGFEGIITYVDIAGQEPQYLASGWHNRESKAPAKPQAIFKIASINKLYAAVAVTMLVNSKALELDRSLVEYLPSLKGRIEYADSITLRMLLQHRSGIPNFTDAPNFWSAPTQSYEDSLALILDKPANFEPNSDYEYNNTNYLLINKIMDDALGYDNFLYIQEKILNPLGLEHTYQSLSAVDINKVMSGYHVGYPYDLKEDDYGMLASAEDVGIFLRALNDGSVFQAGEAEIYADLYKYEHSGWVPGYQSFAKYDKELDAIVVSFYNTTDAKLLNWNLSEIINSRVFKILRKQQSNY